MKRRRKSLVDLLCASHTVVAGYNYEAPEEILARLDKLGDDSETKVGELGEVYGDDGLYYACLIVKRAINSQYEKNAVCKYHVAHEVYTLHPMDLHPLEDSFGESHLLTEHVRIANVVMECYSVLEEIGVPIHASREKPSVIGGGWNPIVKEDLIEHLVKNNISPNLDIPWLTRNEIIRPFKTKVVDNNRMCEWSDGKLINDFNINICDAILELSYMRSQLSAHVLNKKVLNLTVYDAENAFSLARTILLKHYEIDFKWN